MSHARRGLLLILLHREAEAEADFEQCRTRYPRATRYLDRMALFCDSNFPKPYHHLCLCRYRVSTQ